MRPQSFNAETLTQHANGLDEHIRRRNRFEYVAAEVVVIFCLLLSVLLVVNGIETPADVFSLSGTIALAAGSGIVIWQIHSRTGTPGAAADRHSTFASMRAELVRQRDALRQVWLWYLLPFMPGLVLIYGADLVRPDGNVALSISLLIVTLGIVVFICWLNLVAARRMQDEIDSLDRDFPRAHS